MIRNAPDPATATWHTGPYPSPRVRREVRDGYTHLIMAAQDPERSSRKDRQRRLGRVEASEVVVRMSKSITAQAALSAVRRLLSDGKPRTLNAIAVELWDCNACDVHATTITEAMFDAVEQGELEHTLQAPILWRTR